MEKLEGQRQGKEERLLQGKATVRGMLLYGSLWCISYFIYRVVCKTSIFLRRTSWICGLMDTLLCTAGSGCASVHV